MDPKVHFEPVGKDYKLNRFACFLLSEIISNQSKVSAPILEAVPLRRLLSLGLISRTFETGYVFDVSLGLLWDYWKGNGWGMETTCFILMGVVKF